MKTTTFFSAFLLLFICLSNLPAQNTTNNKEVEEIKKMFQDFYVAFSTLDQTKDRNTVLKYWHTSCSRNINYMLIDGTMQTKQQDYKAFSSYLDQLIHEAEAHKIVTTFKIAEFHTTTISGNSAIFSYTVNYETKQDKEPMSIGKVNCLFTLRKFENEWKFVKANITWVEEKLFKGLCSCQVFKNDVLKQIYIIRFIHPHGGEKKTELLQVHFTEKNNENMVYVQDQVYKWKKDQTIYTLDERKQEHKLLGKAMTEIEVISTILQNDLYTENCTQIMIK
ncbi:MAG: hypothetical protein NZ551_10650 [Microscillaceae bacterium]|nr:hypothetical protein [Microscillaceae bacterium]MDW8461656.1 hypothetical protein [Cytophagales bacterium]